MGAASVLIVGCGDVGQRVGGLHLARGDRVVGLVRAQKSAERLQAAGIQPLLADLDAPDSLGRLCTANALLYYFAPPPETGTTDPRLRALPKLMQGNALPAKLIYISTSGVYGDCQGAWVDESTPPRPQTDRAKRRLDAENALREWSEYTGVPMVILRVGGIYGPGRLPVDRVRSGRPVIREEEAGYTNRIHADDLAQVCMAALDRGPAGAIYNVSDGQPGTMTQYFNAVADLYRLPRPPVIPREQAQRQLSASLLSFLNESRRMDNAKMLRELGVTLRYPDLQSGLAACIEHPEI
jgi:nucleoside-diphosphate-sugar epimerase